MDRRNISMKKRKMERRVRGEGVREKFFFFQAEDGIRDIGVTGVQTCALPISRERYIISLLL